MVFTYIWQKDVAKISKVPGAQRDGNLAFNMVSSVAGGGRGAITPQWPVNQNAE